MLIPQRLRRTLLPWLCAVVFVANFLCADAVLEVAWPRLDSAFQQSAHEAVHGVSQEGYTHLTFDVASALAASTGAKERAQ